MEVADFLEDDNFRARNPQELQAIYAELNRLEPIEQDAETLRPIAALFHWPLGLAFVLSLLIALLRFVTGNPRGEHV